MVEISKEKDFDAWQKYNFMLSSFSRIYGVTKVTDEMKKFCFENLDKEVSSDIFYNLTLYDKYLNEQFYNWKRA